MRSRRQHSTIAMDIARRRLRAIEVVRTGDRLRVKRVLIETVPEHLDLDDAQAVGAWIAEQMKKVGMPRGSVTFAIAREHVSLKRLTLPTDDQYELPEMVRLSMQRELPFDPAEAVIDYVPLVSKDGHTTVLVAAIRRQLVDLVRRTAKVAGLKVDRISLRCMGAAALLRTINRAVNESAAWIAIDITGEGVELSVLTDGTIRFSRAAEVAHVDDPDQFAEAVVTETRRSWMSYRIVEDAPEINSAFVFGEKQVAEDTARAVEDLMNVRSIVVESHPRIDADRQDLISTWPLAGLLLEPSIAADSFDFGRPRQAPDRHAKRRQMVLAAAGFLFLVCAAGFMYARKDLNALEQREADLAADVREQAPQFWAYERDYWRIQHLERWEDAQVAWLDHLVRLQDRMPGHEHLLLDDWSGSLSKADIDYDDRARGEKWILQPEITLTLKGEAQTQAIADAFKRSFVESEEYVARPLGPDSRGGARYPYPFTLTLRARDTVPMQKDDQSEEAAAAEAENAAKTGNAGNRGETSS